MAAFSVFFIKEGDLIVTKKEKKFIDDMTRCRGMDWVRLGMMIEVNGDIGTIIGMNASANLDVVFSNQLKYGKTSYNCHPTWETVYFNENGAIIKDFRKERKVIG